MYLWISSIFPITRAFTLHFSTRPRSNRPEVFYKKGVLRDFIKFIGKRLYHRLFFNKSAGLSRATLLKKSLWHRCFSVNFAKFLTPFLQNTSGRLLLKADSYLIKFLFLFAEANICFL